MDRTRRGFGASRPSRGSSIIIITAALALATAGCNKLKARDMLNKGVQAYREGQFDRAIENFQKAKELDGSLLNARLYLATAYASQYIPGAPSEENKRNGHQAVAEFREVLQTHPKNLSAIDGIGSILFQMAGSPYEPAGMEDSRSYHLKHIEIKPGDPEPYYWVGVINWTLAFRANDKLRKDYNEKARMPVKDSDPMPPDVREEFVAKYGEAVDTAIKFLQKATELRRDYTDAMAYLNLLYRQKADMVATPEDRENYLTQADRLVEQVKELRQKALEAPPPPS